MSFNWWAKTSDGNRLNTKAHWEHYLASRTGTLEYRYARFAAVAEELERLGLEDHHTILDVGAGMCEFDYFLRTEVGFKGRYIPVDGSIDGTNLETWAPLSRIKYDFVTGLEIIEHMHTPASLIYKMKMLAAKAVILTTPNAVTLGADGVRAMDETHYSPIDSEELIKYGFEVYFRDFFGAPWDSILAVWNPDHNERFIKGVDKKVKTVQ